MTNEQAIKIRSCFANGVEFKELHTEETNILADKLNNAIKRQMPKKPTSHIVKPIEAPIKIGNGLWEKGTTIYKCPNCSEYISKINKYCSECGQALNWRDEE